MFRWILASGWALFFGIVLLLLLFPTLAPRIPHLELIRPFLITLALVSIAYGLGWLYREGMKRARGK